MEELVVRQKTSRQLKLIVYAVILTAASLFIVLQPGQTSEVIRITGMVGVGFFGICLVLLVMQLVRPKVLLVVNASGISGDYSSVLSTGRIPWQAVAAFGVTSMMGQRFISVDLNDVDASLATLPSVKAKAIRANMALGYPPFSFPMQTADRPIDEVLEVMGSFYEALGIRTAFARSSRSKKTAALQIPRTLSVCLAQRAFMMSPMVFPL